ncbi:MAG TPA: glycosyltransferase family 4 protein [Chloroflexia bacterium]|jgi:glycosyltransferase involved in cell wall biosynthesis|nr:glycosyltransferase family 4 protein [Chloroflexia bacterium]
MRVANCVRAIFPQHGYGGLERAATALTRNLLLRGVDVDLFTRALPVGEPLRVPPGAEGRVTVHPVRYGRLPLPPNGIPARLTNYRAFVEEMGRRVGGMARGGALSAVYAHGLCAWGVRGVGQWGVPLVANPHGLEEFKVRDPLKRMAYTPFRTWVRVGCRAADAVIATDRSMRSELVDLLGLREAKVVVVPNGVDLDEVRSHFDAEVRSELARRWPHLALGDGTLKGISVGRLEQNKGFERLVRALAEARPRLGERWGWVLVGEGSLKPYLEGLVRESGLSDHLFLAGGLSDSELHNLYAMSDLFAHPSLYEGSSLVTLEAMAHGLPVIASAVGGIPDKVDEGETGFLVSPGDTSQLAARIAELATRPGERRAMGERGAARVEAEFSWRSIAAQTELLLRRLIDERQACRSQEV